MTQEPGCNCRRHDIQRTDIHHNDTEHFGLFAALSINDAQLNNLFHYADCPFSECCTLFIVMLNVVMLSHNVECS
jgi:hypothetical protein